MCVFLTPADIVLRMKHPGFQDGPSATFSTGSAGSVLQAVPAREPLSRVANLTSTVTISDNGESCSNGRGHLVATVDSKPTTPPHRASPLTSSPSTSPRPVSSPTSRRPFMFTEFWSSSRRPSGEKKDGKVGVTRGSSIENDDADTGGVRRCESLETVVTRY